MRQLISQSFPDSRLRRNRSAPWIREILSECTLASSDLIWPIFINDGHEEKVAIPTMPGVDRLAGGALVDAVGNARDLGIRAIAIFPAVPQSKRTEEAYEAVNADNLACTTVRTLKKEFPDIGIITDVALDRYTTHGQDGLVRGDRVINDETVELLCQQALLHARAGADYVAPSDMMDGRVSAIRKTLDGAGFSHVGILAYSAKFASRYYGPFRDAVESAGGFASGPGIEGKRTYHMNPANGNEALREAAQDIAEGADIIMVKPGLPYLDVIKSVKEQFGIPTFAYHVSGEYAMLKAAAQQGYLEYDPVLLETLTCFKRAGADAILTYAAVEAASLLLRG